MVKVGDHDLATRCGPPTQSPLSLLLASAVACGPAASNVGSRTTVLLAASALGGEHP